MPKAEVDFVTDVAARRLTDTLASDKIVCLHGADALNLTALALTSALGEAVGGKKIVYVASEGGWHVSAVLARLGKARNLGAVKGLFILPKAVDMLKARNVDDLVDVIAKKVGQPDLIMLDCLAYCFGADELNPAAMEKFVANVAQLQERTGAHVLLLHRTGPASVRGARSTAPPPEGMTLIGLAA